MKDYLRDYATAAFRFYAQNGKSAEKYKKKIYDDALEDYTKKQNGTGGISCPTEAEIIAAEDAVDQKLADIKDMEAVELVIAELMCYKYQKDVVRAIEHVYFKDPNEELKKGDIHARVNIAAVDISASENTVYKWLKKARDLFALKRGLRIL
jgi:dGTP triphosphohydrolase